MYLPQLDVHSRDRLMTEEFRGYNHNLKIADGEWYTETNITSRYYPLFSQRDKRGVARATPIGNPLGIFAKDKLVWIDGNTVYYGADNANVTVSTAESMLPKRIVSMGAYCVIFPDKVYFNTKDSQDRGTLEGETVAETDLTFSMCRLDGTDFGNVPVQPIAPANPGNGDYWIDTSGDGAHVLKQWVSTESMWTSVSSTYIKITSTLIGSEFNAYDGVKITGLSSIMWAETPPGWSQVTALDEQTHIVYAKGDDYLIIPGFLDYVVELSDVARYNITFKRPVPDMDFVIESENRLWGCKSGLVDGKYVNEIYACKQGDPKNWYTYMGLSTDSYAVTVGTDGPFTGAITYQGHPLFFKENYVHKIFGSMPSDYQVVTSALRGVQQGCDQSLCIVNEVLYYKTRYDVVAYDGSIPVGVSDQLNKETPFTDAVAGAVEGRYYISMLGHYNDGNHWQLFVYDTARKLWHREDNTHALFFANLNGDLLYVDAATKLLMSALGRSGTEESSDVSWSAETGIMGYEYPDAKYVSRFNIRARLWTDATLKVYLEYDSDTTTGWILWGEYEGNSLTKTFTIPIIPRRCDHFRMKITGTGGIKIYSIAKILEVGSDAW